MADASASVDMSKYTSVVQGNPTIVNAKNFNAEADCEALQSAFKGMGCDTAVVIQVLCNRSSEQRQKIATMYQQMFGKKLKDKLKSELKGNTEELFLALMETPEELDCKELRQAMKGAGTDEQVLVDVLCSRTNEQIQMLKRAYKDKYGRNLDDDVSSETSSDFGRILVSMLAGGRDESDTVNVEKAKMDAQQLYGAGQGKWGTDEEVFNKIFGRQSYRQLKEVFTQYENTYGTSMPKVIEKEFSGDIKKAHYALASCIVNRPAYFAEMMHKSMKGMGTDDSRLIWAVVSRAEIDLVDVKKEFMKKYGESLEKWISGDASGKYKQALLAICKGNKQ